MQLVRVLTQQQENKLDHSLHLGSDDFLLQVSRLVNNKKWLWKYGCAPEISWNFMWKGQATIPDLYGLPFTDLRILEVFLCHCNEEINLTTHLKFAWCFEDQHSLPLFFFLYCKKQRITSLKLTYIL